MLTDNHYIGLPWKSGGRSRDEGVDCAGLALLWLREQIGFHAPAPASDHAALKSKIADFQFIAEADWQRGDVVFFRHRASGELRHVAICLGVGEVGQRFLHILNGYSSRIDNGLTLLRRSGLDPVGALAPADAETLCRALNNPKIGWGVVISIVISLILYAVTYALRPSSQAFKNRLGRYSQDALITAKNPEVPLPDILGAVVVAGNAVYQQLPDRSSTGTGATSKWNQIIVLASGPVTQVEWQDTLQLKGVSWQDAYWHDGATREGICINPPQTLDGAIDGAIGGDTNVPSITIRRGTNTIAVAIDIRAQYDRDFPVYGMSGYCCLILRAYDLTKFSDVNLSVRIKGRALRTFDTDGFITASDSLSTTGDAVAVRFKLPQEDIVSCSSVTVDGVTHTEMSATNQTGSVYSLNRRKGYIEFLTPPGGGGGIVVAATFTYYVRAWTQNPITQAVYMLTDPKYGKGFDESRLDWASAVDARDYCDASITFAGADVTVTGPRFICNYVMDDRKPIHDHLKAILDACNTLCFFSNGQFFFKAKKADDTSVFSFTTANILLDNRKSSFEADLPDRTNKVNRVKLLYHSDEALQAETEFQLDDTSNQEARADRVGNNGVIEDNLKYPAVTTPDQAERLAHTILTEEVQSRWLYKWKTSLQGLALQPGDVVDVTHPSLPQAATLLRLEQIEIDEFDRLSLTASEFVPSAYL